MAISGTQIVGLLAATIHRDASPQPICEALAEALLSHQVAPTADQASEQAEALSKRYSLPTLLERAIEQANGEGRSLPFVLNSSSSDFVQGVGFVQPNDPREVAEAKRLHALLFEPIRDLLPKISPSDFELLATRTLQVLGVPEPQHTPLSQDGGIDCFGLLHVGLLLDNPIVTSPTTTMRMWLVCQAKRYSGSVGVEVVRELIGSVLVALEFGPKAHLSFPDSAPGYAIPFASWS